MAEIEEREKQFKSVSKLAQSLVKESSQSTITDMLGGLRVIKDRLVRTRKDLPEKLRPLKSSLSQVEALENGISDLTHWITEGEALLESHRVDGNINQLEERLHNHKTYFSEIIYYKTMLESKNKVYQKLCKSSGRYLDIPPIENKMIEINQRFQVNDL